MISLFPQNFSLVFSNHKLTVEELGILNWECFSLCVVSALRLSSEKQSNCVFKGLIFLLSSETHKTHLKQQKWWMVVNMARCLFFVVFQCFLGRGPLPLATASNLHFLRKYGDIVETPLGNNCLALVHWWIRQWASSASSSSSSAAALTSQPRGSSSRGLLFPKSRIVIGLTYILLYRLTPLFPLSSYFVLPIIFSIIYPPFSSLSPFLSFPILFFSFLSRYFLPLFFRELHTFSSRGSVGAL